VSQRLRGLACIQASKPTKNHKHGKNKKAKGHVKKTTQSGITSMAKNGWRFAAFLNPPPTKTKVKRQKKFNDG
jgi:hypothetical protein